LSPSKALIFGGKDLANETPKNLSVYAASATSQQERTVVSLILASPTMPFVNLSDTHKSRWGDELTAEKMKECVWLRPEAVAQIEFLVWTEADRAEAFEVRWTA